MPVRAVSLDRTDRKLLELLQHDGHLTNQQLADAVALSPSPCLRRVRRLEESGVIRQYVALLEPQALGLGLLAYVNVKLDKRATGPGGRPVPEHFAELVQLWPEVVACYALTGDIDYLMRVHVEDLAHFSRFVMQELLTAPGVVDVRSSFALQKLKDTTALPLTRLAGC